MILARTDLNTSDLKLSNAQAGNFVATCTIPASATLPAIPLRRGWVAVDAKIRGKSFRFISTHLDGDCLPYTGFQQAQAAEVLGGPAATDLPVVLVGDLNSPGDGSGVTYNNLIVAGFGDAAVLGGVGGTFTCCQADDILNPVSILDRRIDVVLFRSGFTVLGTEIVGELPSDRTPSGLWPSDHAGVVSRLRLPNP